MAEAGAIARKTLIVVDIISETPDTKSFVLECVQGKIDYKAGQFLTLIFKRSNGVEARRSYSISSSPELDEPLTITVKRIVNGEYSRYLNDKIKKGDLLETIGASGFFVIPETVEKYKRIIFMAAGSGITPVYALIKTILIVHPGIHVLLLFSNTGTQNAIFVKPLEELKSKYSDNLSIQFLFSRSHDAFSSRLTPESLEMFLHLNKVSYNEESLFYVCGPAGYMRMITYRLTTLGVDQARIKKEIFHVQHPKIRPEPPDTKAHTVMLMRNGGHVSFNVQYPVTILQAAKLLDIHIPYSCESGQCGTCVAKCLQGTVWMAQNEVLLEEEIKNGIILTCTGYPVYGDVTIKL
ncbi:MAG TPA: ferredoxin--NADP reductase [Flavitalea sp.]|nr:ferredoxin--NADP reductase [Flavitalea sp.]